MDFFLLHFMFCLHVVVCALANPVMTSDDKSDFSPLTSSKSSRDIPSMLGGILNRESFMKLSMVQIIQGLVKDVIYNKRSSVALKTQLMENTRNLHDINETISKENDAIRVQLQKYDLQVQNISSKLSSVHLKLLDKNCMEILQNDPDVKGQDGVYSINVGGQEKKVYCDMTTDGGGWTVIQKREDGSTDFYRDWTDYKNGFGDPSKNYWIGNNAIHTLTLPDQELRVDLQSFDNQTAYSQYSEFKVGSENTKYQLTVGGYSGTAGDSLAYHNGHKFSTRDQDNDVYSSGNCAVRNHGAWWYDHCAYSNLNGQYGGSAMSGGKYTAWWHWKKKDEALKSTKIMIRPKS